METPPKVIFNETLVLEKHQLTQWYHEELFCHVIWKVKCQMLLKTVSWIFIKINFSWNFWLLDTIINQEKTILFIKLTTDEAI